MVRLLPSGPDPVPTVGAFGLPSGRHPAAAGLEGRGFTGFSEACVGPRRDAQVFGPALSTCRSAGANPAGLVPASRRVAIALDGEGRPEWGLLFRLAVRGWVDAGLDKDGRGGKLC